MNAIATHLGLCVVAVALSACNSAEPTRSVEWFIEHRQELKTTLTECEGNPGELAVAANCINAKKAQGKITWGAHGGGVKAQPITY